MHETNSCSPRLRCLYKTSYESLNHQSECWDHCFLSLHTYLLWNPICLRALKHLIIKIVQVLMSSTLCQLTESTPKMKKKTGGGQMALSQGDCQWLIFTGRNYKVGLQSGFYWFFLAYLVFLGASWFLSLSRGLSVAHIHWSKL